MKKRQLVCIIAGLVAVASLSGCQTDNDHRSHELSSGRMIDDSHLNERVKTELKNDPVYKFGDIYVSTFAGVVQLSGFATIEAEKQRAQTIAENVRGVNRVENGITLKPAPAAAVETGRTNADQRIYSH